ncbi:MAG: RsmE family RNA methyltransferase [Chitinophagales bacterium]
MKRFFSNTIPVLSGFEANHAFKVLRCKEGELVEIIDGSGKLFRAKIFSVHKNEAQLVDLELLEHQTENQNKLSIAIAPTKNSDRIEFFLEKATEIGVDNIYFIETHRTERNKTNISRYYNKVVSACKQSKQLYLPIMHTIQSYDELLASHHIKAYEQLFIAHCNETTKQLLTHQYQKNKQALLLIGPEGDFTEEEINLALNKNFVPVSLGNTILRVETAGIVACVTVNNINNENSL